MKAYTNTLDELTFTRLSFQDTTMPLITITNEDMDTVVDMIKDSIDSGEKCNIKGRVALQRVILRGFYELIGDRIDSNFL